MKLILPKKFVTFDKDINIILKKLWYENGNNLSIQYAGTPAIKSDIILTGRITFIGLLNDLINSIKRYFINRYSDGKKQSVYNILTGANFQLNY
ncbi:sac domain protein 7 [Vairimorpha apis BRL 01]|uniref:Sac domain protein 7 n=1 Tax=Vairimorpha apis BRL 01 TaxID=1037528 RepID=T0MI65_9MICR|nr:sac domain protein 7 [Vairimorpha apis BRL 01]